MAQAQPQWIGRVADAVGYAVTVTAIVFGIGAVVMIATGTGWFVTELVMFLLGWVVIAYGTVLLNPDRPWKTKRTSDGDVQVVETSQQSQTAREETAFQRLVQWLPPMRWYPLGPDERFSTGVRVFLSGIFVLLASFGIERILVV